ncbi:MAG: sensor histidine kinase [Treponema sp.]|jgi:signal transduction histidine kinase|nr:sensor histidine kinase [Treponema sp.]
MFLKYGTAVVYVLALFVFSGACARQDESGEGEPGIQEIVAQWTAIERAFLTSPETPASPAFAGELDGFSRRVDQFAGSRLYRMYRYIPFSRAQGVAALFEPPPPNEVGEAQAVKDLIRSFQETALRGDREKALASAMDIHEFMLRWQHLDLEAEKFTSAAYFELFLVFTFFIAAMVLTVWFLHRALKRSLEREQAGSVFSRALVLAQEEERSRIAGELHDTVAQDLRYLALRTGKIGRTASAGERESLCREVAAAQKKLIDQVRNICDGLVPPDFRFLGLPDALRRLCRDFGARTGIDCRIDVAENLQLGLMGEDMQLQVFRIVQEALNNVEKHAGAAEAIVVLRNSTAAGAGGGKAPALFVSVSDDGAGFHQKPGYPSSYPGHVKFDAPPADAPGHLGIRGMYERCAILKGALTVESEAGEGAILCLEVPLEAPPEIPPGGGDA